MLASGTHFYCRDKPQGSPFVNIARVIVASIWKWNVKLSSSREDYHYHNDGEAKMTPAAPKKSFTFRFLNNAALETEGDLKPDGSIARPWRLCTLQQVEDLKTTIRILPCWSSNIFISTPHRDSNELNGPPTSEDGSHIGSHFNIPVGSVLVVVTMATYIALPVPIIDCILYPVWQKLTHNYHCDGPFSEVDIPVKLFLKCHIGPPTSKDGPSHWFTF